ncbi:hypothetical protein YC2023_007559 [Brassica napus]
MPLPFQRPPDRRGEDRETNCRTTGMESDGGQHDIFTVGVGWMLFGGLPFDLSGIRKEKETIFLFLILRWKFHAALWLLLSPLRLIDGLPCRRSFNYNQMPEEPIKLTVLKLDESSFDQRLLNEADYLIELGIKDGDQLRFIRHISNYCTMMVNHKSKIPHASSLKQLKLPSRFSLKTETWKKKGTQGKEDGVDSITKTQPSFILAVLGGWLSYKSTPSRTKHRNVTASTSSHLRAFNNLIARFRFKCYSEKDVWNRIKLISENMK